MSPRKPGDPYRVLVVDDSLIFAEGLRALIQMDPELNVVGVARDGLEALEMVRALEPDVMTMDLRMPRLGGLEAIERVMAERPTPILVLSAAEELSGETLSRELRKRGAVGHRPKPGIIDAGAAFAALRAELKTLAAGGAAAAGSAASTGRTTAAQQALGAASNHVPVVALVASTGGPSIVAQILSGLDARFAAAVLVVQHITKGFDASLVSFLGHRTPLPVRLAKHGDPLEPGVVLVAPDGAHLATSADGRVQLDRERLPLRGHRPSGSVLLQSLAKSHGRRALGVVLTGMGDDGSDGLLDLLHAGGTTVAQDAGTAVVDGMPRAAREAGAAQVALPYLEMARFVTLWARGLTAAAGR